MNPELLAHNNMCSDSKNYTTNIKKLFLPKESFVYPFKIRDYLIKKLIEVPVDAAIKIIIGIDPVDYPVNSEVVQGTTIHKTYQPKSNSLYPPIYCYAILYTEGAEENLRIAAGRSYINVEEAMQKAFGEYIERTSLKYTEQSDSNIKTFPKWVSYEYKKSSFRIYNIPTPTKRQRILKKFPKSDDSLIGVKACYAVNTSKNKNELLPMQCAYYHYMAGSDIFLHPNTTNGGGGGISLETARLSAIYELIERDSFFLHWLSGIQASIINIDSITHDFRLYLEEIINKYDIKIYILNTTFDTKIFSCNVVIIDQNRNKISLGGSCGASVIDCIKKATIEAISGIHYAKNDETLSKDFLKSYIPFSDTAMNKEKRMHIYNNNFGVNLFIKTFLCGKEIEYKDLDTKYTKYYLNKKVELKSVIETFKKLSEKKGDGYNLYFHEAKGKLIDKYSYYVSRAYVPSFTKLWLLEETATPVSKRLEQFAEIHGKIIKGEIGINTLPHPFP